MLDDHIARSLARTHTVGACSWRRMRLFDRLHDPRWDHAATTVDIENWSQVRATRKRLDAGELTDDPTPYELERFLAPPLVAAYDDDALVAYRDETAKRLEAGWDYMADHGEGGRYFGPWWRLLARYEVACDELEARRGKH